MQRIMTQLAEDKAYAQYEEELTEELQEESDKIRYGNAHKGIPVNINRMSYVDSSYMEFYQKVAPPLLLISKRLQKQIRQILKDYKEGGIPNHPCSLCFHHLARFLQGSEHSHCNLWAYRRLQRYRSALCLC